MSEETCINAISLIPGFSVLRPDQDGFISLASTNSFTPTIKFGGGSTGIVYSKQYGKYTKIGNIIFFNLAIGLSNKGSSTGIAVISLGIAPALSTAENISLTPVYSNILFASPLYTSLAAVGMSGSTNIRLVQLGSNMPFAQLTDAAFSNGSILGVSGSYFSDME